MWGFRWPGPKRVSRVQLLNWLWWSPLPGGAQAPMPLCVGVLLLAVSIAATSKATLGRKWPESCRD